MRPVDATDDELLDALVVARAPELAVLPVELQRMQRRAQEQAYAAAGGSNRHLVIEVDGEPVGRVWSSLSDDALVVLDIVLLPEHRGEGTGTAVLTTLAEEADSHALPVRLHVAQDNSAARRLYERLGFHALGVDGLHVAMERR